MCDDVHDCGARTRTSRRSNETIAKKKQYFGILQSDTSTRFILIFTHDTMYDYFYFYVIGSFDEHFFLPFCRLSRLGQFTPCLTIAVYLPFNVLRNHTLLSSLRSQFFFCSSAIIMTIEQCVSLFEISRIHENVTSRHTACRPALHLLDQYILMQISQYRRIDAEWPLRTKKNTNTNDGQIHTIAPMNLSVFGYVCAKFRFFNQFKPSAHWHGRNELIAVVIRIETRHKCEKKCRHTKCSMFEFVEFTFRTLSLTHSLT